MSRNTIMAVLVMTVIMGSCGRTHVSAGKELSLSEKIKGCWGVFEETGNSVLCFEDNDSVFWVDPSEWCTYTIENDTIIMWQDSFEYFRGRIEYRNDSLFLSNDDLDFAWAMERYQE